MTAHPKLWQTMKTQIRMHELKKAASGPSAALARLALAMRCRGQTPTAFEVDIWHELLWYGYHRESGIGVSGLTPGEVRARLRAQLAEANGTSIEKIILLPVG